MSGNTEVRAEGVDVVESGLAEVTPRVVQNQLVLVAVFPLFQMSSQLSFGVQILF